uniref:Ig-like domain-containing protein n=1 Tax=Anopheles culicifacies TaxID=139723 RepID=A0A182MF30_9DIPT
MPQTEMVQDPRWKDVPVCATEKLTVSSPGNGSEQSGGNRNAILIGASRNENVEIPCHIFADPPARSFHWRFNNSAEILQVDAQRYTSQGNISILNYAPMTDQDYGTLTCWAVNEVGPQSQPCTFQLVLADLPSPVSNCSLPNRTQQFAEIQCTPGYDGGLPQVFVLELISKRTGTRRFNFSNKNEPFFVLDRLEKLSALMTLENNSLSCVVYAINQKGRSTPVLIQDFEIGRIQPYRPVTEHRAESVEWLPIAVGILLTVIILALSISTKTYLNRCFATGGWCGRGASKRGDTSDKSEQQTKNVLLPDEYECGAHCLKLKNVQMLRRHSSRKKNCSKDSNDDEPEPDVIPAQFNMVSCTPLIATPQHSDTATREKDALRYGGFASTPATYQMGTADHPGVSTQDTLEYRTHGSIVGILPPSKAVPGPGPGSSELDINVIKDRLLTTRVPESCV